MATKKLLSVNFNTDINQYITEEVNKELSDAGTIYSPNFIPVQNIPQSSEFNDFVRASTGGAFEGKIYYNSVIPDFTGSDIPTAEWVEQRIQEAITIPPDFEAQFDSLFPTKFNNSIATTSIEDLGNKSHSLLTDVEGGTLHVTQAEKDRITTPASSTTDGYLTSVDWNIFNSKQEVISTGTGLNLSNNNLTLVLNQIDHNQLLNYNINAHRVLDDNSETSTNLWSASKIVSYVSSQIPVIPTDFVSASSGGVFGGIVSYNNAFDLSSDPLALVHKTYLDNSLNALETSIYSTLSGTGANSVKLILGTLSLLDLGTKQHSALQGVNGNGDIHLSAEEASRVTTPASATTDGYLTKEDWTLFNSKLGSFSVIEDTGRASFIKYDSGVMYYNPLKLDHDSLTNYDPNRHALLDDTSYGPDILWSSEKISSMLTSTDFQSYRINLKSGTTVAQRLVGLVEGQDYPTGWTLADDGNALIITHNLNSVASVVNVFSVNGITSDAVKLEGNVAYATLTNLYINDGYNAIRLDAFATVTTDLIIKIIL